MKWTKKMYLNEQNSLDDTTDSVHISLMVFKSLEYYYFLLFLIKLHHAEQEILLL